METLLVGVLPTLFRPTGPLNAAQTEQQQQKIVNKPHQQQPQQPVRITFITFLKMKAIF